MKKFFKKLWEWFKWLKVNSKYGAITLLENVELSKEDILRLKKIIDKNVYI
ncbi:hypothetical protein [Mycoplasmopsis canis]|uniref:hypothetical protein n=1 Tax=Mycoplasmopsis canis TaxID=29555 RepID=UPI000A98B81C|nr:hypothetical protein [Mycoplasmopsis canis]